MNLILQTEFDFQDVEIKRLNGYENANYLIKTNTAKYVFKTYRYNEELLAFIEAENETNVGAAGLEMARRSLFSP